MDKINKAFLVIIPLFVIGIAYQAVPFTIILITLVIRLCCTSRHTAGIFLLMFGGVFASTIRFEIPALPAYGLVFNFLGVLLLWDQVKYFRNEKASILTMLFVLAYFLLAFYLSPNTHDIKGPNKIWSMVQFGLLMLFGYYAFIHSSKIENETLTQSLFLLAMLFLVHNMNLLHIVPNGLFDYEWLRGNSGLVNTTDESVFVKFVNYQTIGMYTLFGVCMYISQRTLNIKKAVLYSIIGLQLVLTSGSRQGIFGFFIIAILAYIMYRFSKEDNTDGKVSKLIKYTVFGAALVFVSLQVVQMLNIEYLTETISGGDKGRDMLLTMGMNLFYKYPIFGAGIAGFNHAYPGMLFPHNVIVEILCECGLFGLLLLLFTVINHLKKQNINIFYLTRNGTFIFMIMAVLCVRMMVSDDLTYSIQLFSAIFACTLTANEMNYEEIV